MIVKRLTQALKRQDWEVVSIEFMLVVVGVLLAFQINEWANGREAANEREAATERLLAEAEESVAYLRQTVVRQQELVGDLNYALAQVQSGGWQTADRAKMTAGLSRARSAAPLAPPSSVYEDVVASGAFGKMGNADLRLAISKYRSTLGFSSQVRDKLSRDMPRIEDFPALTYKFTLAGRQRIQLKVDYPALAADHLLQEKLALLSDDQRVLLLLRENALKDAGTMCVELGRFIGRQCNLNRPLPTFG